MKSFLSIAIIITALISHAWAKPKVVPTASTYYMNTDESSPPIAFSRLVFNVPNTQKLGRGGFKNIFGACAERYTFELESNSFNVENRIFINSFTDILRKANYKVPGDPNSLFTNKNNDPEFLIAAMISDFEIDYCQNMKSGKGDGQLYMKLDWQVYNIAKEEVVFRKQTEGYHKIGKMIDNILYTLLEKTFNASLYNFIETDELANILSAKNNDAVDPQFENVTVNYSEADPDARAISIAEARQSVVTIKLPTGGHGSGFIISEKGHILTNEHVVGGNDRVLVVFDNGIEIEGEVMRKAPQRDVALIKIPLSRSKPLPIKPVEPDIGTTVFAIGSPLEADFSGTVSQGIISAFRLIDDQEYIQSDALINGGNSGGPMIDENGNVVAISVSGRTDGDGVNFFIPIRFALEALNIQKQDAAPARYTSGSD